MGILANSVSLCHFRVTGDLPEAQEMFQWVSQRLALHGFRSIDDTADELSTGWVQVDDHRDGSFSAPSAFWRDHYLVFTLRRDQRRIPASILKAHVQEAMHAFLQANPGMHRVPKQRREELKENVRLSLMARTFAVPATYDAVWDTRSGLLTFTSLSAKTIEVFEGLFKKTFDGLRLVAFHPMARAEMLADEALLPALKSLNQASTEAVLDLMKSNQWIGSDFLLWLMYRCMNGVCTCRVNRSGHSTEGEEFVAYLNDRLILFGGSEEGVQKVTVAGPQDHFREVLAALNSGKRIAEATLYLEQEENVWRMTLKGETFHFGSFRSPAVKIEKDDAVDEQNEREAVFYERMYLLERGLQLFDCLFALFLGERLGDGWAKREEQITRWIAAGMTAADDAVNSSLSPITKSDS